MSKIEPTEEMIEAGAIAAWREYTRCDDPGTWDVFRHGAKACFIAMMAAHEAGAMIPGEGAPEAQDALSAPDGPQVAPDGLRPTSDARSSNLGHPDRVTWVDGAGGTGDDALRLSYGAPWMSFADAERYVEQIAWRVDVPSKSDQALRAYARQLAKLREDFKRTSDHSDALQRRISWLKSQILRLGSVD